MTTGLAMSNRDFGRTSTAIAIATDRCHGLPREIQLGWVGPFGPQAKYSAPAQAAGSSSLCLKTHRFAQVKQKQMVGLSQAHEFCVLGNLLFHDGHRFARVLTELPTQVDHQRGLAQSQEAGNDGEADQDRARCYPCREPPNPGGGQGTRREINHGKQSRLRHLGMWSQPRKGWPPCCRPRKSLLPRSADTSRQVGPDLIGRERDRASTRIPTRQAKQGKSDM